MSDTSTTSTTSTQVKVPNLGGALTALTEFVAGELAKSPTVLKAVGILAAGFAAVPGDIGSSTVRAALIGFGGWLVGVVHLAEARK